MKQNLQGKAVLSCVELVTSQPVKAVVIWLHGLGADGHDFVNLVPELKIPENGGVRFIFPHAPVRPITINQGMPMRGWYDITSLTRLEDDVQGILESVQAVEQLIQQQIDQGIPSNKIVLAGFSQGGAIALHVALRSSLKIGGVLALSTYLPASDQCLKLDSSQKDFPIFLAHGNNDEIIPLFLAEQAHQWLKQNGLAVEWHQYPMAHQVCSPEIVDIRQWLTKTLGI